MQDSPNQTEENVDQDILNSPDTSVEPETTLEEESRKIEEELLKWRDVAARTAAEFDNFRKRTERDKDDLRRYANIRLLEELLPVIDNFDMGMQAAAQDSSSMIYIGMQMVRKQLEDFLANQNVTEISAENQPFDHSVHEAIGREERADLPDDQIIRVVRKGYRIGDRLLRPANVIVSHLPEAPSDNATGQNPA